MEHITQADGGEADNGETADNSPTHTLITLSKIFPANDRDILIPAPINPLDAMGITVVRLGEIKGAIEKL